MLGISRSHLWRGLESLERRRMLAADLTSAVIGTTATAEPGDLISFTVEVRSLAGPYFGTVSGNLVLSRDAQLGNSDDIVLPSASLAAFGGSIAINGSSVATFSGQVQLPASIPAGQYHAGTTLTVGGGDSKPYNNGAISNTPLLTVRGSPTEETLVGTDGDDHFIVSYAPEGLESRHRITLNGDEASWLISDTQLDRLIIDAGEGNDRVDLRNARASLRLRVLSGNGNDTVWGGPGNDTLLGGAGDDVLLGYGGDDRIEGGEDEDILQGGDGADLLNGNGSADRIWGGGGKDRLNGHGGRDRLYGEGDADRLYGYDGNDLLDGGSSNDRLYGGSGADYFVGGNGDDFFAARDGERDTLILGGGGVDTAEADEDDPFGQIEIFR